MFVCGLGFGVGMEAGRPCPPVRNDIVTPRHLLQSGYSVSHLFPSVRSNDDGRSAMTDGKLLVMVETPYSPGGVAITTLLQANRFNFRVEPIRNNLPSLTTGTGILSIYISDFNLHLRS